MTEHPAAYETVSRNDLSLFIPLEDLRDIWELSGSIGQEIYGAGMAPAMAALALPEVMPGVVVYSGYPVVSVEKEWVTFAGVGGAYSPVAVSGVSRVVNEDGTDVETQLCGLALCFLAEGGGAYQLIPG
jgi:cephalosporin-C deacetylase-like acetyl esterase